VNAILAYNELHHGRRDAGGAEVFLGAGTHVWTGGVVESHQPPQTLLTVTSFPGLQREEVILSGQTGSRSAGPRVRLCNLTLRPTGTCFSDMEVLVVEGCHVDTSAPTAFYEVQNSYWLHNRLSDAGEGALAFYSNLDTRPALIRGNTFDPGFEHPIFTYTVLGNRIYTVGGMWNEQWGQTIPHADPCVVAFNFVTATSRRVLGLYQGRAGTGAAVVQNIFERRESGYAPNVQVAADGSTEPVHNVLFWHNTLLGQRYNGAYNDLGEAPAPRFCWSLRNNAFDDYNIKADTFDPPHGARVGNWPVLYGTGCSGNAKVYVTGCGAWGFDDEFPGLSSLVDQNVPGTFLAYRYNRSYSGDGAGDGDYHPTGSSPLLGLALHQVLPFDLEGVPRRSGGASGAYEAGDAPQPRLELLAPNGSEIWRAGEERDLVWTAEGLTGNVVIELLQNGSPVGVVAASVPVSAQRFTWKVGALEDGRRLGGPGFCIRIRSGRQAGAVGKMWKEAGGGRRAEGS